MIEQIRYVSIKTFWFFVRPMQVCYWFLFRPHVRGVKCLISNSSKELLLVRLNYAHRMWTLPGGGVKRGESYENAARRELKEETGLSVGVFTKVYSYTSNFEYKQIEVEVFFGTVLTTDVRIDPIEIAEAQWFPLSSLPTPLAPSASRVIEQYLQKEAKKVSV